LFQKKYLDKLFSNIKEVNYSEEITFEQMLITDNSDRSDLIIIDRQVTETGMVSKKALGNYHWFKKDIIYYLLDDFDKQLPKVIESNIIPWVKNKNRELEKERED